MTKYQKISDQLIQSKKITAELYKAMCLLDGEIDAVISVCVETRQEQSRDHQLLRLPTRSLKDYEVELFRKFLETISLRLYAKEKELKLKLDAVEELLM